MIIRQPFLALCTRFGLEHYIMETLGSMARMDHEPEAASEEDDGSDSESGVVPQTVEGTPLLAYALEFPVSRQKTIFPLSSHSLVSSLIHSPHRTKPGLRDLIGAPNLSFDSPLTRQLVVTPWTWVLSQLRDARRGWIEPFDINPEGTARWTRIVRILAREGGADRQAFLRWNGFDEEAYARDVIVGSHQLGGIDDWWIRELRDLYQET